MPEPNWTIGHPTGVVDNYWWGKLPTHLVTGSEVFCVNSKGGKTQKCIIPRQLCWVLKEGSRDLQVSFCCTFPRNSSFRFLTWKFDWTLNSTQVSIYLNKKKLPLKQFPAFTAARSIFSKNIYWSSFIRLIEMKRWYAFPWEIVGFDLCLQNKQQMFYVSLTY